MSVQFVLAATPALEEFGGPPEDSHEGSFIDLNLPALAAKWVYDGEHFVVRYELDSPQGDDTALSAALADLMGRHGPSYSAQSFRSASRASYGVVFFQAHGADTMHAEYLVESLRGAPVPETEYPCRDGEVEAALRRWLQTNEAEVVATVRDEAGELR